MTNYYRILGVSESASPSEIKLAYKQQALLYHPDKHAGNITMEELFKEINQAYQVLSNPYEKAKYDLRIKYEQATSSFEQQVYPYTPPTRASYHSPVYSEPPINWRENWIATAYAFGFTFILAAIVMSGIGIKRYLDLRALEELLAKRRETFQSLQTNYRNGQIESALSALNGLGIFRESEQDMEVFKNDLFDELTDQAEIKFINGTYGDAIYYYELIENYGPNHLLTLKEHLAKSYRGDSQPKKAIQKFTELLLSEYRKIECHLAIAVIYHKDLNDPYSATPYYETASKYTIEKYESIYGEAYPLIINSKHLPPEDYYLYTGLAQVYLESGNPEQAVKATAWNVNMWPDSVENYITAAKGFHAIGEFDKACSSLAMAQALGALDDVAFSCP